jgi:hypothetical protein
MQPLICAPLPGFSNGLILGVPDFACENNQSQRQYLKGISFVTVLHYFLIKKVKKK